MYSKVDSDIGYHQFRFFQQDYEILSKNYLGLPNCLHCGHEPIEMLSYDEWCDTHLVHIRFQSCGHLVGIRADYDMQYDGASD